MIHEKGPQCLCARGFRIIISSKSKDSQTKDSREISFRNPKATRLRLRPLKAGGTRVFACQNLEGALQAKAGKARADLAEFDLDLGLDRVDPGCLGLGLSGTQLDQD